MESLFEYDPPSWYDDEPKRQAQIREEHDKERRELGVSVWDIYNFDSYYSSLVFSLAKEAETRDMNLSEDAKTGLSEILQTAYKIMELEKESDKLFDLELRSAPSVRNMRFDRIAEIDREQGEIKSKAMEKFIFEILPSLPSNPESWERKEVDRSPHGIAEEDYDFIGDSMRDRLVTGIQRLAEHLADETQKVRSHHPSFTMEGWVERLRQMSDMARNLTPESSHNPSPLERKEFMEHFIHLWV